MPPNFRKRMIKFYRSWQHKNSMKGKTSSCGGMNPNVFTLVVGCKLAMQRQSNKNKKNSSKLKNKLMSLVAKLLWFTPMVTLRFIKPLKRNGALKSMPHSTFCCSGSTLQHTKLCVSCWTKYVNIYIWMWTFNSKSINKTRDMTISFQTNS